MKVCLKSFFLSVLMSLVTLVSCVQEANDGSQRLNGTISDLSGQVASVSSSLEQLNALQNVVEQDLSELSADLEAHIGYLKSGVSRMDGTMATLQLQKEVAMVVAELQAAGFESSLTQFVKSVKSWLGKSFETYFDVLVYGCTSQALVEGAALQLSEQHSYVDAVLSDVEAGLRDGVAAEELASVLETLAKNLTSATELTSKVDEIVLDLETECAMAVEALFDEPSSYDATALKKAATQARIQLKSAEPTISDLVSRIETIESAIETIKTNLSELRADVDELLGMIQSLTFVSEYSDDKAVAYYEMTGRLDSERGSDGKKERVPAETFDLTFLVRPAAVADALAQTWQESQKSLSVVGYYANRIQQQATANIQSFEIANAVSTHGKGLLTVTVKNAFDDEFYFKEKGAMLALSVESGINNCVSKFVEIVPRDITGKVYAESITLTPEYLSIQDGDSYKFSVVVAPSNVTDAGVTWKTYGTDYFTVSEDGRLTATKVGSSPVEVIANSTDEWGRALTAKCDVDVTPAIRINGPAYVEVGGKIKFTLESPNAIQPNDAVWNINLDVYGADASDYVKWTKEDSSTDLVIEGLSAAYNQDAKEYYKFDVTCTIGQANPVVVRKELRAVYIQPNGVELYNGLPNDADEVTVKIGQQYNLAAKVLPDAARESGFFRCKYESNAEYYVQCGLANYEGPVTAVGIGTATITIRVLNATTYDYYYPKDAEFKRYIKMHVEPYWVTGLSLSAPEEIDIDVPNKINPVFVSDVNGVEPTYQTLIWESLTEDVAEVDNDGNVIGKKEGTAIIRARSEESATKDGVAKEATCTLTVVKPGVEVVVGEYYFSDGTWGSKSAPENAGKTAIGVIFAKVNAAALDSHLGADHSDCTHGLAIGLKQSTSAFVENRWLAINGLVDWLNNNGYDVNNTTQIRGYGNTKGLKASEPIAKQNDYWNILVDSVPDSYTPKAPAISSGWYVPSFYEMSLIKENITAINNAITSVSGNSVSSSGTYWTSTICYAGSNYGRLFDMSTGNWYGQYVNSNQAQDVNDVRVVLAF